MATLREGTPLPSICDNCGYVFPSGVEIGDGTKGMFFGVKSGPCPRCGGVGSTPDGVYEIYDEARALAALLARRPKVFRQATKLAEHAANGTVSPKDAVREARKISPKLATLFSKARSGLGVASDFSGPASFLLAIYLAFVYERDVSAELPQTTPTQHDQEYSWNAGNSSVKSDDPRPRPRPVPEPDQTSGDNETSKTPDNDPAAESQRRPRPDRR